VSNQIDIIDAVVELHGILTVDAGIELDRIDRATGLTRELLRRINALSGTGWVTREMVIQAAASK